MQFGEKLKALRKKKKLNQQEVADMLGVSLRAYAAYETKNVRPRKRETYEKMADVFECDVNELLLEDSTKIPPIFGAGLGLFGLGTSLTGPLGALAAAALTPVALNIFNRKEEGDTYENWVKEQEQLTLQFEKKEKQFSTIAIGILLTELGKKGIKCQVGEVKDLTSKGSVPDAYIKVDSPNIDEWWFVFWSTENRENEQYILNDKGRTYLLFNRFGPTVPDPRRKASIILNDKDMFDEICKLKRKNSYRGNLSVMLIDTEDSKIIKEELLSSYDIEDNKDKLAII